MRIELLGITFTVRTDEDPEYLKEVVALYTKKVAEVQRTVSTADPLKIAILAGILTADDLMKLTGESRSRHVEVNKITSTLIGALDGVLDEAPHAASPPSPDDGNQPPG